MNSIAKFTDHLEFLGYSIEDAESDGEDGQKIKLALSDTKNNYLLIAPESVSILYFRVSLTIKKRVNTNMYEYLDEYNGGANVARAFVNEEADTVVIESHYTGDYDKKTFGDFLSLYEGDQRRFTLMDDFQKIWI